jgi:hypothetical protein
VDQLKRQVKTLRRLGFGFAVDDAGAGYASFALIAALRPSIIKIDRLIAAGVARDDAKQALVEAFVSFGRRIGARLLAEGIERRADLSMLSSLGVELGQGYLIGRPAYVPQAPRPFAELRPDRVAVRGGAPVAPPRAVPPRRKASSEPRAVRGLHRGPRSLSPGRARARLAQRSSASPTGRPLFADVAVPRHAA